MAGDKQRKESGADKGKQLGRYRIVGKIGEGRMGKVYKAYDTSLERVVALKLLSQAGSLDTDVVQRFIQEAKSTARLTHPSIVALYDFEQIGKTMFLAMELIDGYSLDRLMHKHLVPFHKSCKWMIKILDAVGYAHEQGIIHRDLKPSNIMINKAGQPFVADFGLSKALSRENKISRNGAVIGTPAYMSPEQAKANPQTPVDHRSDIYSLGAIMYELLTGKPPLEGDNVLSLLYKIVTEEIPSPRKSCPKVPPALERICMKALAKEPDARYQSCREMAIELTQYLKSQSLQPIRMTAMRQVKEWCEAYAIPLRQMAVAILLVMAGVALWFGLRNNIAFWRTEQGINDTRLNPTTDSRIEPDAPHVTDQELAIKRSLRQALSSLQKGAIEEFLSLCTQEYCNEDLPEVAAVRDHSLKIWGEVMQYAVIDTDNAKLYRINDQKMQINVFWGFKVERNVVGKEEPHYMAWELGGWKYDGDRISQMIRTKQLKEIAQYRLRQAIAATTDRLFKALGEKQTTMYEQCCSRELLEDQKTKSDIWKHLTTALEKYPLAQWDIMATADPNLTAVLLRLQGLQRPIKLVMTRDGDDWKLLEMRPFHI